MESLDEQKRAWRERLRRLRAGLTPAARAAASECIRAAVLRQAEMKTARCVFCFISTADEVDTRPLIDAMAARSMRVLVPKIPRGQAMMAVPFEGWDALDPGTLGIPAPRGSADYQGVIDVCLTPGLGFTPNGQRLGYGRGYYDQWFRTHTVGTRIGIAFDCQLDPELPAGPRDVPLDRIITETRVLQPG